MKQMNTNFSSGFARMLTVLLNITLCVMLFAQTATDRGIIDEINSMRTGPKAYATTLQAKLNADTGLNMDQKNNIQGVIDYLNGMATGTALQWSGDLYNHAKGRLQGTVSSEPEGWYWAANWCCDGPGYIWQESWNRPGYVKTLLQDKYIYGGGYLKTDNNQVSVAVRPYIGSELNGRPFDARFDDVQYEPEIIPYANTDGSITVAWRYMYPERSFKVSTYSGANWSSASHVSINSPTALGYIAGMTKDDAGNTYVLTAAKEQANRTDWGNGNPQRDASGKFWYGLGSYRANVLNILKIANGGASASLFADMNSAKYSGVTIYNPVGGQTPDFAYGNNTLALAVPHNWAWDDFQNIGFHQRHSLLAIGTTADKPARYKKNGLHYHNAGNRITADGTGFVNAGVWEGGVWISKLTENAANTELEWSGHRHIFNTNAVGAEKRTRLGGIGVGKSNYVVAFTYGTPAGNLWSDDWAGDRVNVYFAHSIAHNFDSQQWADGSIPAAYNKNVNLTPGYAKENASARRLKLVNLQRTSGLQHFAMVWEKWVNGDYNSTWGVTINETGGHGGAWQIPGNPRIQDGADGVLIKKDGKKYVAWVTGDMLAKKLVLHTIEVNAQDNADASSYKSHTLSIN